MFWFQKAYTTGFKLSTVRKFLLVRRYESRVLMIIKKSAGALFLSVLSIFAFDLELPSDERDLFTLLEEQLIDTLQYEQLLVYYALPLCVPQGELTLLAELFPFLKDIIPDAEQLETYHPFDNRQIQKFFSDFPYLFSFEPVLRFNVSSSSRSSNGEIIFGVNKSKIDELEGQRVRFRQKSTRFSMDGSIVLNDSGAVFRSRRVTGCAGGLNIELGNFKQPLPGELFFGNFSPLTTETESIKNNWLYGSLRGWNGAAAQSGRFINNNMFGVCADAFYHLRVAERGAGAGLDIYALRGLRIHAGFTAFQTNSVDSQTAENSISNSIHTAHLYAEYKNKVLRAVFETGFPLEQEILTMPLAFRLNYRLKSSSAQYHLISYPSEFDTKISRLRKQILSEIGEREYRSHIRKHSLKMTVPFWGQTKLIPEIDFTESGTTVKRVYGRTQLKARTEMVDFSVKHSSKIFTLESDSVFHVSGVSVYLQTPYPLGVRAAGEYCYGAYKYERTSYSIDLQSSMLPNMIIVPFIRGRYSLLGNEFWFGLKHELHLYKKNWSGITIEIPYNVKGDENVYIRGSSSFTF